MGKLTGKVAVVTGASKGIGSGVAEHLASEGAAVAVNYATDRAGADGVVNRIEGKGGRAVAVQGNTTSSRDVEHLFERAKEEFRQIDILVNNAGVFSRARLEQFSEEEFHRVFNTNLLGPFLTCREALKYFNHGGSIINIGANATKFAPATISVYAASKAGLDMMTRGLSKELGPRNIRVNSVNPGGVITEGSREAFSHESFVKKVVGETPLGRLAQPEDIAKVVTFLASDESYWLTGQIIFADGGI